MAAAFYSIRLNPMLEAEELPTGISYLTACLANMDVDDFSLNKKVYKERGIQELAMFWGGVGHVTTFWSRC